MYVMSVQQKHKGKKKKKSKVNACDVGTEKKQRKTKGKNTKSTAKSK
jgi:hypothetical protein